MIYKNYLAGLRFINLLLRDKGTRRVLELRKDARKGMTFYYDLPTSDKTLLTPEKINEKEK